VKILISGYGSIGKRHATNLVSLGHEVFIYDSNPLRYAGYPRNQIVESLESMPLNVDAFVVCTPPDSHLRYAILGLSRNAHVFIEKPIAAKLDDLDEFSRLVKQSNKVVMIGYCLRFHPGLQVTKSLISEIGKVLSIRAEFGQYLPNWRPQQDYRESYTSKLGIILDGSHEIDYMRWLAGEVKSVFCVGGKLSSLDVKSEDMVEIVLNFESGAIGNIHLDFVQRIYSRSCKIIGELGTIEWDFKSGVKLNGIPKYCVEKDMYLEEMRHFIDCIGDKESSVEAADTDTGIRVLKIALAAKESMKTGKLVSL